MNGKPERNRLRKKTTPGCVGGDAPRAPFLEEVGFREIESLADFPYSSCPTSAVIGHCHHRSSRHPTPSPPPHHYFPLLPTAMFPHSRQPDQGHPCQRACPVHPGYKRPPSPLTGSTCALRSPLGLRVPALGCSQGGSLTAPLNIILCDLSPGGEMPNPGRQEGGCLHFRASQTSHHHGGVRKRKPLLFPAPHGPVTPSCEGASSPIQPPAPPGQACGPLPKTMPRSRWCEDAWQACRCRTWGWIREHCRQVAGKDAPLKEPSPRARPLPSLTQAYSILP